MLQAFEALRESIEGMSLIGGRLYMLLKEMVYILNLEINFLMAMILPLIIFIFFPYY